MLTAHSLGVLRFLCVLGSGLLTQLPLKYWSNFWFSAQMNSINSESGTRRWSTLTVHGLVYAFGSSTVMSISSVP